MDYYPLLAAALFVLADMNADLVALYDAYIGILFRLHLSKLRVTLWPVSVAVFIIIHALPFPFVYKMAASFLLFYGSLNLCSGAKACG